MPRVKAVLFDLDGVLVDSHEAWWLVVNDAARSFGVPEVDRARFESVWGQGISADVESLYPGRTHEEVEAAYEAAFRRHARGIVVNPEARPVLAGLRSGRVGTACVTNTQIGLARAILSAAGLDALFDDVEGMAKGVREKPAPDLLLTALDALGVAAPDAWMVGDTRYDEEAASAAGTPFLRYDLRAGASLAAALRERGAPL
jgi:phosphoglycolate phosphatase-like HAD superfamily hydrolase